MCFPGLLETSPGKTLWKPSIFNYSLISSISISISIESCIVLLYMYMYSYIYVFMCVYVFCVSIIPIHLFSSLDALALKNTKHRCVCV